MNDGTVAMDLFNCDSISGMERIPRESVHLILSDIPYGIGCDGWDVLHDNANSAYMGASPAQEKGGALFRHRGKPLNGWSMEDRTISAQYGAFVASFAKGWLRCLVPGASALVMAGRQYSHRCACAMEDAGFILKDTLAWDKTRAPFRAQRLSAVYDRRHDGESSERYRGWRLGNLAPVFEPILWFVKPYRIGGTVADNMLEHGVGAYDYEAVEKYHALNGNIISLDSGCGRRLHPAQKPVRLMELLIELTTQGGQTVLDPFMGSGTTGVACQSLGRNFIGFELDPDIFGVASRRLGGHGSEPLSECIPI